MIDKKLKKQLERHEGRSKPIYLCSAKCRTIGIGHNIDAKSLPHDIMDYLNEHGEITDEMIDRLLENDVATAEIDCKELYPEFPAFSQPRQFALIDFLFNVGMGTAKKFVNTNAAINRQDWQSAARGLQNSRWHQQVGKRGREIVKMIQEG